MVVSFALHSFSSDDWSMLCLPILGMVGNQWGKDFVLTVLLAGISFYDSTASMVHDF